MNPLRSPIAGIYFLQGEVTRLIKIGFSRDIATRIEGFRAGSPDVLVLIGAIDGSIVKEKFTHYRFAGSRRRGEWFAPSPELLTLACSDPERLAAAIESVRLLRKRPERQATSRDPDEPMPETFAARLRWWRGGLGVDHDEAGKTLGVRGQTVATWERGDCCPSVPRAPRVARAWGISVPEYFSIPGTLVSERQARWNARPASVAAEGTA